MLGDLVWPQHSVQEQETFLGMMQSCGLCFRARNLSGDRWHPEWEYIAPDLLPGWADVQDQLFGRLRDTPAAAQATASYSFLHEGILRTFLSRIGQQVGDAAVYWKYGCWFGEKTTGSVMLIRSDRADGGWVGKITLSAWGGGADELLDRVLATLLRIPVGQPPQVTRTPDRADSARPDHVVDAGGVEKLSMTPQAPLPGGGKKQVFVSYAWGDDSPQGRERGEVVERLCRQVRAWGYEVVRDKDHMRWGEIISAFMKLLGRGDRVIVNLSAKYLRSIYCMTELHEVFVQSRAEPADFLSRIVPHTLADARIDGMRERNGHVLYWKEEVEAVRRDVADGMLGPSDYRDWHKMNRWVADVSEMLKHIADVLHPRGFEQIVADDFAALNVLLERGC
jgi:internalin A